jgi:hypothetical protein
MFEAMLLAGLRRCEVVGLRLCDVDGPRRQVFIVEGKGGHQRKIPISRRWFTALGNYLTLERPTTESDVRGVEGTQPRAAALGRRAQAGVRVGPRTRRARGGDVSSVASHVVSPGSAKPGWNSRRCRPSRGTGRWTRPGSTSISLTAGSLTSTTGRFSNACDADLFGALPSEGIGRCHRLELASARAHADDSDPGRPAAREVDWPEIAATAPTLAATMLRYVDQLAVSLRPSSVCSAEGILRRFAGWLVASHPDVRALVDVERRHIEGYKAYLATRPGQRRGSRMSPLSIRIALGTLRTFFERVSEWDYPDAPTRVLVFNGDPDTVPATTPASSTIPPDLPDRIGPVIRSQEYESSDPNAELPASIAEGTLRLIDDCLILDTDPLLFALVLPYGTSWDETTDTVDMGIAIAVGDRIESGSPIAIENVATLIDNGHLSPDGAAELQRCIDVSGTPSAMELRGRH